MEENNSLGVVFLNGGLINLDSATVQDIENRLKEAENLKSNAKAKLDKLTEEIRVN